MPDALPPDVLLARQVARLQSYRQHADSNRNFKAKRSVQHNQRGVVYFRNYPPEVQRLAWEHLSSLCIKHKDKLRTRTNYIGPLVATATRLALDELGFTQISKKGFNRLRTINRLKVDLGIADKNPNHLQRRVKRASQTPNL